MLNKINETLLKHDEIFHRDILGAYIAYGDSSSMYYGLVKQQTVAWLQSADKFSTHPIDTIEGILTHPAFNYIYKLPARAVYVVANILSKDDEELQAVSPLHMKPYKNNVYFHTHLLKFGKYIQILKQYMDNRNTNILPSRYDRLVAITSVGQELTNSNYTVKCISEILDVMSDVAYNKQNISMYKDIYVSLYDILSMICDIYDNPNTGEHIAINMYLDRLLCTDELKAKDESNESSDQQ